MRNGGKPLIACLARRARDSAALAAGFHGSGSRIADVRLVPLRSDDHAAASHYFGFACWGYGVSPRASISTY